MITLLPDQVQERIAASLVDIVADPAMALRWSRDGGVCTQELDEVDFAQVLRIGKLLLVTELAASPLCEVIVARGVLGDEDDKGRGSIFRIASEVRREPDVAIIGPG